MSKWLALARETPVPIVPLAPIAFEVQQSSRPIGTNDAIGTGGEDKKAVGSAPIGTNDAIGTTVRAVTDAAKQNDADARRVAATIKPQTNVNVCHICEHAETTGKMFIPILSGISGRPFWMHQECWPEHARRCETDRENAGSPS